MPFSDKRIEDTKKLWEKRLGRDVPDSEAIEMLTNFVGFYDLLIQFSKTNKNKKSG